MWLSSKHHTRICRHNIKSLDSQGFTLMEVMVALAVFAAAAGLLMVTDGNSARHTRHLSDKWLASQLAENQLNQQLAASLPFSQRNIQTTVKRDNRTWLLKQSTSHTSQAGFIRLTVSVYEQNKPSSEAAPLVTMTTFVREPVL
ncbi:type II secretion system minor pseudopilin GspI [Endozoicomonas acroporae]|uniref:type II secretion system minor pseudopilin GspI n=1 Tax=Endozoicomonas acroporae TaxID=1701104 RepID=UPI003D799B9E